MTRITLSQAAIRAGVCTRTLQQAAKAHTLRAERAGSVWLTTNEWLDAWMATKKVGRPASKKEKAA